MVFHFQSILEPILSLVEIVYAVPTEHSRVFFSLGLVAAAPLLIGDWTRDPRV